MTKKKKIILVIAFIVVAIVFYIIGGTQGYGTGYREGYNAAINSTKSEQTGPKSSTDAASSDNSTSTTKMIPLKTAENLGNIELKILKAKESPNISNEAGNDSAAGKFVIIEMQMKNLAKQAISYDSAEFALDDNGTTYTVNDNAFSALGDLNSQETIYNNNKDFIGVYDKFNPGITKKTYLVFDVPKDFNIANAKLIIDNNNNIQFNLK